MRKTSVINTISNFIVATNWLDTLYLWMKGQYRCSISVWWGWEAAQKPVRCLQTVYCYAAALQAALSNYRQRGLPIGCSAQVQPSHWSKVEREGSNHGPLSSAGRRRWGGGMHSLLPHCNTSSSQCLTHKHTQRYEKQTQSWSLICISPRKCDVLQGKAQIALN